MLRQKLLTIRFNNGDADALRQIYELYKDELVSLAAALLYDKTIAEDAVHDVFAKLIAQKGSIKITSSLRNYLLTAVANAARQKHRADKNKPCVSLDQISDSDIASNYRPDISVDSDHSRSRLAEVLTMLPYDQREVILLRHFSDLKFKAIASIQNVSINTVQGRYRYGLDKLRSLLNGELR